MVAHLGLTPQSVAMFGGFKAQGRDVSGALRIIEDSKALEDAGVCMILLEAVPPEVGKAVTKQSRVPVIGIGAGPYCDGQCLVVHDMLGMFEAFTPKFAKKYVDIREQTVNALRVFKDEVNKGEFPKPEHCYRMPDEEVKKLEEMLKKK